MVCPKCGTKYRDEKARCPGCGYLPASARQAQPSPKKKPVRKGTPANDKAAMAAAAFLLISIIVLILHCTGVIDTKIFDKRGGESPVIESSTPAELTKGDADPAAKTESKEAENKPAQLPSELPESPDAGQAYIDKMVFLGDSTTYGMAYYDVLPISQVWSDSAGTLALFNQSIAKIVYTEPGAEEGTEMLIADAVKAAKPEYLVITIGVNGVAVMDETYFKSEYTALIESVQKASPDTKIICNSIYPVESSYEAKGNGITNAKIDQANLWIKDVAEQSGVHFCNTASVLKDSVGCLSSSLGNGDGLHLNPDGFSAVLNYLRTHAYT